MGKINKRKISLPGYRNIKTAIAIIVCVILYQGILNREGAAVASVAAIICMQDTISKSLTSGFNRVFGTIVGGIFGVAFVTFPLLNSNNIIWFVALFAGVVILIHMFNLIKKHDSIVIGVIVFISIVMEAEAQQESLMHSIDTVVNTIFGIIVAVTINGLLFRPDRVKIKNTDNINLRYDFKEASERTDIEWSGGSSTELYIYPKHSFYSERNFKWRLSTATVETEETMFTKLDGYMRLIMITDGHMQLSHKGYHAVFLKPYQTDYFNGAWETKSHGVSTDFNLIMQPEYNGNFECVYNHHSTELVYRDMESEKIYRTSAFYALHDNSVLNIFIDGKLVFTKEMKQYDFIIFFDLHLFEDKGLEVQMDVEYKDDYEVVALRTDISDDA